MTWLIKAACRSGRKKENLLRSLFELRKLNGSHLFLWGNPDKWTHFCVTGRREYHTVIVKEGERGCVRIRWLCLWVSSGPPVGQHVSAPAASLSQAVISTYHSDRPAREDTGTHNPQSGLPLLHFNIQHCSASPLFSFGVETCQELQSQQSWADFSSELLQLQQRGFEASRATARPGKSHFSNCRVCWTSAPNGTMWYVEGSWENKEINFGQLQGNTLVKNQNLCYWYLGKKRRRDSWAQQRDD